LHSGFLRLFDYLPILLFGVWGFPHRFAACCFLFPLLKYPELTEKFLPYNLYESIERYSNDHCKDTPSTAGSFGGIVQLLILIRCVLKIEVSRMKVKEI